MTGVGRVVNIGNSVRNVVYIGRGSPFGNPYRIGHDGDRAEVISLYRAWFLRRVNEDPEFRRAAMALDGRTLGCYCKPQPCHGDVIVEWLETHRRVDRQLRLDAIDSAEVAGSDRPGPPISAWSPEPWELG